MSSVAASLNLCLACLLKMQAAVKKPCARWGGRIWTGGDSVDAWGQRQGGGRGGRGRRGGRGGRGEET